MGLFKAHTQRKEYNVYELFCLRAIRRYLDDQKTNL